MLIPQTLHNNERLLLNRRHPHGRPKSPLHLRARRARLRLPRRQCRQRRESYPSPFSLPISPFPSPSPLNFSLPSTTSPSFPLYPHSRLTPPSTDPRPPHTPHRPAPLARRAPRPPAPLPHLKHRARNARPAGMPQRTGDERAEGGPQDGGAKAGCAAFLWGGAEGARVV